jgi:hypothetical protein
MSLSFYLSAGFGGSYVVYFPALARRLGSAAAAILLGRLLFLQTQSAGEQPLLRAEAAERYVILSLELAAFETGLGLDELKSARRRLEKDGLIQVEYRRLTHELRWQVDLEQLDKIGDALSSCFNAKVENPLSGTGKNNFGEVGKSHVDKVNDVFLKAEAEAEAAAATFNIDSKSHPDTAAALCALASTNHRAKRDSNVALSEKKIKQALELSRVLVDDESAAIVNAVDRRGGWLSDALNELKSAASLASAVRQRPGLAILDRLPIVKEEAAAGAGAFCKKLRKLSEFVDRT